MAKPQPKLPTETDRQFFRRNLPPVALFAFWFLENVLLRFYFHISSPGEASGLLVFQSLGVLGSQVVLLALMFALFPASLLFRFLVVIVAAIAIFSTLLMGATPFDDFPLFVKSLEWDALPIVLLGLGVPFILARHFLRWRLHVDWMESAEHANLSVADLMIATCVVALAVSLLGFGSEEARISKLMIAAGCMGASFVVFIPMTYLLMTSRRKWVWLFVFSTLPLLIGLEILAQFGGSLAIPYWVGVGISTSVSALFLSFGIGLVVIRRSGGRLATSTGSSIPVD